ncbi:MULTISPECIES: PAS domain-containing hybrid sensor histidine kinase/response regulator [Phenylobacterium]|uniref:histidine kinase n=1 Tax=Phenylobacterium koreense TaxID=266125 RepID=A0ABV2EIP6_9CAUL
MVTTSQHESDGEVRLAEAERIRHLLCQAAGIGSWRYDPEADEIAWSEDILALTGYRAEDLQNLEQVATVFHPDDAAFVRASLMNGVLTGEPASFEHRLRSPDGGWTHWRITFQTELRPCGQYALFGVSQNITELARARDAAELNQRAALAAKEAKAAFLANVSHEIRTPMNGVMGVLHLLKSEPLSDEGRGMLEEALSCGEMLADLLNDVIDFSKIEAGQLETTREPLDPVALVENVAKLLRPQAQLKNLLLKVEAQAGVGWVLSDPIRLRQALFNLVGNAVKFTLKGEVMIRIGLRRGERGQMLRLEIADTGVGIPEAVQPRIFQRFDQGDASTTRRFGGSGLGLSITRRLAEMLGGGVGFASTEGLGSVFWLEVEAPSAAAPAALAQEAGEAVLDGLRVLVVEDNPTNRMIASRLLQNLGAAVETAHDGLMGVEAASRGAFDLILMDVQMPGIDGLEAARRIRGLGGGVGATPIIALTANVLAHQQAGYLQAGMDGVVGKPISPAALLAEIVRLAESQVRQDGAGAAA